jgi:urea carboxylase
LLKHRADFLNGRYEIAIEETTFRFHDYREFLRSIEPEIADFRNKRETAFAAERDRWKATGVDAIPTESDEDLPAEAHTLQLPDGVTAAEAPLSANVWQVLVKPGAQIEKGDKLVILEAMKMEIAVLAPVSGQVTEILCNAGKQVTQGQMLCLIEAAQ